MPTLMSNLCSARGVRTQPCIGTLIGSLAEKPSDLRHIYMDTKNKSDQKVEAGVALGEHEI